MHLIFITHSGTHKKNIELFTLVADKVTVLCYQAHAEKQLKRINKLGEESRKKVSLIPVKGHFDCFRKACNLGKRADVIFGHDPLTGFLAAKAGLFTGKKSGMLYCQDFLEYFYVAKPRLFTRIFMGFLLKLFLGFACRRSAVFALSSYTEKSARKYGARKVYVTATYGVDTSRFKPAKKSSDLVKKFNLENAKVLMCTSRMSPEKGIPYAISAFQKLSKEFPDLRLLLVGKGSDKEFISKKIKELNLEKQILFTGNIEFEEMHRYYQLCDIFIMPSLKEGLGFTSLEALACGKSVVATTVGGIPDAVPEYCGILIPPANVNAIVNAVKFILNNPEKAKAMSERGIQHVRKNFEEKIVTEKFIHYFQEWAKPTSSS